MSPDQLTQALPDRTTAMRREWRFESAWIKVDRTRLNSGDHSDSQPVFGTLGPWTAADLWTLPKMQVGALVCVGLAWCSGGAISRSSPGFLQRRIVAHGSCPMADWPSAVLAGPRSDTGQHDRPPIPGQQLFVGYDPNAAVGVAVGVLHSGEHPSSMITRSPARGRGPARKRRRSKPTTQQSRPRSSREHRPRACRRPNWLPCLEGCFANAVLASAVS